MLNKKVVAAIGAAVNQYILEEQGIVQGIVARPETIMPSINLWGLAGRYEIMKTRTFLQVRTLK